MIYLLKKLQDKHLIELLKGSSGYLIVKIFGLGIGYVFMYMALKWYGAAAYGIFTFYLAAFRIAILYGRLGLDNALLRFIAEYASKGRRDLVRKVYLRGLKLAIPCSLVLTILLFWGAPYLAHHVLKKPHVLDALWKVAMVILPGTLLFLNASLLRGLKRVKAFSFLLNTAQYFFGCLILVLGKFFFIGKISVVDAYAMATVFAAISSFVICCIGEKPHAEKLISNPSLNPSNQASKKALKDCFKSIFTEGIKSKLEGAGSAIEAIRTWPLFKIAIPMLLTGSFSILLNQTGIIVLTILKTDAEVGIFGAVFRISTFLTFTLTSINSIAGAKFSECYALNDMKGFEQVTHYSTRLIFWTTVPVGIIFMVFPKHIIGFFDKDMASGATALVVLVIGYFINAIAGPVGLILSMTGHQVVFQNIVFIAAIINIILCIVLVPVWGINGAAIANMVGMIIWNLGSIIYVKKKLNILSLYIPNLKWVKRFNI